MYNKNDQETVIELLRKIDEKLDKLSEKEVEKFAPQGMVEVAEEITPAVKSDDKKATIDQENRLVWNLTQTQYELSNELFNSVQKLKNLIKEGERHTTEAKGKYQK